MKRSRVVQLLIGSLLGLPLGCGADPEGGPSPMEDPAPSIPPSDLLPPPIPPLGPPKAAPGFQQWPAAAVGGGVTLVVWMDDRGDGETADIYGARLGPAGELLDRGGFPIAVAPGDQEFPEVVFAGTDFLVAWEDGRGADTDIYAARVTVAGKVLDPAGLPVSRAKGRQAAPALAALGGQVLVVWQDGRDSTADGAQNDIYGARLRGAELLDPDGLPISQATARQAAPTIAPAGEGYFVAWQDLRSGTADLYGTRVSSAGLALDTQGLVLSSARGVQSFPMLISGGGELLLSWNDGRGATTDIFAARLSAVGKVLSTIPVSRAPGDQQFVSGAWDGARFLLAWQDERGDTIDVYGARIEAGKVTDADGVRLSAGPAIEAFPRVVFDGKAFEILWQDLRNGAADIYGARLGAAGTQGVGDSVLISNL